MKPGNGGLKPPPPADIDGWADDKVGQTLKAFHAHTIASVDKSIAWYVENAPKKGRWSRRLRRWAIIAGTAGLLLPVLLGGLDGVQGDEIPLRGWLEGWILDLDNLGYVLLALAAAFVGADSAFGLSSS